MSNSSKSPRVVRKHDKNECFTEWTYRKKSFGQLMDDFSQRCAYSMLHVADASEHNMEVDHHNPNLKGKKLHSYGNLYPAYSICNNAKRHVWPTKKDLNKRRRFLDCCKEIDYGVHLFEDAKTGEIKATTPEGLYHSENCDLNNPWLKQKRVERLEDKQILATLRHFAASPVASERLKAQDGIPILEARLQRAIPEIPPVPDGETAL